MKYLHRVCFCLLAALFLPIFLTALNASPFGENAEIKTISVSEAGKSAKTAKTQGELNAELQKLSSGLAKASCGISEAESLLFGVYSAARALNGSVKAEAWLTDAPNNRYLSKLNLTPCFSSYNFSCPQISVDETKTYQSIDGFGFALTGASAWLLSKMSQNERTKLLKAFFDPKTGIGASMVRVSIGASDLSRRCFSYDEALFFDKDLSKFSIMKGDKEVIPILKEILAIAPSVKVLATPWSAPRWMKTLRFYRGHSLRKKCYPIYAQYFVKYIQAMKQHGVNIYAVTPQNEPENGNNAPSMKMTAQEQAEFIGRHLGPALEKAGLGDVNILCYDHNCDHVDYPITVLENEEANKYTNGVAWHLYAGDISALSEVHNKFSDKKMYLTEQYTANGGSFYDDLKWHIKNVLIGSLNNWAQAVLEWNLASDAKCSIHTLGGCSFCKGAVTIEPNDKTTFNVAYYIIGHASKFIRPNDLRIASESSDSSLVNAAFKTAGGHRVLIVLNNGDCAKFFNIRHSGKTMLCWLNAGAAATYVW